MQLLDKKSIVQQKSVERKLEIDEGAKLALTIDNLRKTKAEEEAKLSRFRDETVKNIKLDLKRLEDKKLSLKIEVQVLEDLQRELRKPLDSEWEKVNSKKIKVDSEEEKLSVRISQFLTEERNQVGRARDLDNWESRLSDMEGVAVSRLSDINEMGLEAAKILDSAKSKAEGLESRAEERNKRSISRELTVAGRERDIINHKELLDKRENLLNKKEKAINDKYQTLIRTQARLAKKT